MENRLLVALMHMNRNTKESIFLMKIKYNLTNLEIEYLEKEGYIEYQTTNNKEKKLYSLSKKGHNFNWSKNNK